MSLTQDERVEILSMLMQDPMSAIVAPNADIEAFMERLSAIMSDREVQTVEVCLEAIEREKVERPMNGDASNYHLKRASAAIRRAFNMTDPDTKREPIATLPAGVRPAESAVNIVGVTSISGSSTSVNYTFDPRDGRSQW